MTDDLFEWGRHNRAPLPAGESARLETLNEKILAVLKMGPQTNRYLSHIALDYGRRIRDLRRLNHNIRRERIDGGLNLYTLLDRPDPEWEVSVHVRLADGQVSDQVVTVNANNRGTAFNKAQHKAAEVKIIGGRLKPVNGGTPATPPESPPPPHRSPEPQAATDQDWPELYRQLLSRQPLPPGR